MQQLDGFDCRQEAGWKPALPTHAAKLGPDVAQEPGRIPWLETVAAREQDLQAQNHIRTTRTAARISSAEFSSSEFDLGSTAHSLAGLVHDARNMVAAMDLYCDLLDEPGVLSAPFQHYAAELRLVGGASRTLLERLAAVESLRSFESASRTRSASAVTARLLRDSRQPIEQLSESISSGAGTVPANAPRTLVRGNYRRNFHLGKAVENLADELLANQNLLAALVGPAITLGLSIKGGHRSVAMAGDDLTRVLVNLARNAAEAMPGGGHIQIALEEGPGYLSLSFTDNGPGIPQDALESIFSPGYSTHIALDPETNFMPGPEAGSCAWPAQHRGLGLSIVRSLVASAGGSIWAANRRADSATNSSSTARGAIFTMEFPLPRFPIAT